MRATNIEETMSQAKNEEIEFLLKNDYLDDWTRRFCESLQQQLEQGRQLSDRQLEILGEKYQQHGPEAQVVEGVWSTSWDDEKEEIFRVCALYYRGTAYYNALTNKVSEDGTIAEGFIPRKREYQKMCNNKYAMKVRKAWFDAPKFPVGSLVAIRSTAPNYGGGRAVPKHKDGKTIAYFIVETNSTAPKSACAGAKCYTIIAAGSSVTHELEERHLKKLRRK